MVRFISDSGNGKGFHGTYRAGTARLAFEKVKVLNVDELLAEMEKKTAALNELGRKRYRLMDELEVVKCQMECIDPSVRVALVHFLNAWHMTFGVYSNASNGMFLSGCLFLVIQQPLA
jgi:hypothetical protein